MPPIKLAPEYILLLDMLGTVVCYRTTDYSTGTIFTASVMCTSVKSLARASSFEQSLAVSMGIMYRSATLTLSHLNIVLIMTSSLSPVYLDSREIMLAGWISLWRIVPGQAPSPLS